MKGLVVGTRGEGLGGERDEEMESRGKEGAEMEEGRGCDEE